MRRGTTTIGVVGAGAAGTLTATRILHEAGRRQRALNVLLIDPRPDAGRGVAYSTTDPRHLLNVTARAMTAVPEDADHFLRWLAAHGYAVGPCDFAPRQAFGAYLADTLRAAAERVPWAALRQVRDRAVGFDPLPGGGCRLVLAGGDAPVVDAVVLATGQHQDPNRWAPPALAGSDRLVGDPWAAGALGDIPDEGDVLCVGTGLTMVDITVSLDRPGRVVHGVSRSGLIPHRQFGGDRPVMEAPELPDGPLPLRTLQPIVRAHLGKALRRYGDWRPGFDSLRGLTQRLWSQLPPADQAEFLTRHSRRWDTARHRIAAPSADALAAIRAEGRLRLHRGTVATAAVTGRGADVTLSTGQRLQVVAVVDCTGPQPSLAGTTDPLLRCLLDGGLARTGPHGLGLDTDADGRLLGDAADPPVFTLGALRRGHLWETTAVPEIRTQAAALARRLVGLAGQTVHRPRDCYGLPVSTTAEAADAWSRALDGIRLLRRGVDTALQEAVALDPGFAMGHAALALIGSEWELERPVDVEAALRAALQCVDGRADDRERSFVVAVKRRLTGTRSDGDRALLRHIGEHPRDVLAVSAALPTVAFAGLDGPVADTWRLVDRLAPDYGDDWWFAGIRAFARQEQQRWDDAAALADRALTAEPAAGHAVHAMAHVYYETGEHEPGLRWLDGWIDRHGREASCTPHFSWHAALHELSLDDSLAVRRRYDAQLAPPAVVGSRALVDSASLLWRGRLVGAWVGRPPIDPVLGVVDDCLLTRPATPFGALHAATGWAAAGGTEPLDRLRRHAVDRPGEDWRLAVVPFVDGLLALLRGTPAAAVAALRNAAVNAWRFGGSAAQQEIVLETLITALIADGRADEARRLLELRLDVRPCPLDRRRRAKLLTNDNVR
jgi:uncharacterized NAD(P)/FAD-binding protein YdhS